LEKRGRGYSKLLRVFRDEGLTAASAPTTTSSRSTGFSGLLICVEIESARGIAAGRTFGDIAGVGYWFRLITFSDRGPHVARASGNAESNRKHPESKPLSHRPLEYRGDVIGR
jgi:hypothetical protein